MKQNLSKQVLSAPHPTVISLVDGKLKTSFDVPFNVTNVGAQRYSRPLGLGKQMGEGKYLTLATLARTFLSFRIVKFMRHQHFSHDEKLIAE